MKSTYIHNAILYLTFYTLTLAATNQKTNPHDDALSLVDFKSVADTGNNLVYSVQKSSAVCKWQGVQCQINGKVFRLVLENLNLAGVFAANTLTRMEELRVLSLRNNSLTGPIPDLSGLVNLKSLFLDHNYFTGAIPSSIPSLHRLRTLDLSHNKLSGVIPGELCTLDRLNYLRLDSNRFNGSIPPLNQSLLHTFNVSDNLLTGPVPVTPTLARFGTALFSFNHGLCGVIVRIECGISGQFFGKNPSSSSTRNCPGRCKSGQPQPMEGFSFTNSNSTKHKRLILLVGFSAGLLVVIISVICIILSIKKLKKKKKKRNGIVPTREIIEIAEAAGAAADGGELKKKVKKLQGMSTEKSGKLVVFSSESQLYTVEHLMRAPAELLGSGTLGTTYKAVLDNRVIMSVKRLDASRLLGTTDEAFERQMEVVGRLRHPNLVALRAYFLADEEKLLVCDYKPNGSLFSLIHGSKSLMLKSLHWTSCLKIAEDVAQGLCYLHQTCNLVHGNLKASNVLLGSDFEACLSDYYLSALFHRVEVNGNGVSAAYKEPESHLPNAKSDVYSFGVLLLELLTGKTASEQPYLSPDDLVTWVKSNRDNGGGGMEEKRVEMMTEVAIACSVRSPELSPTMWQVIKMLQEIKEAAVMEDCGLNPWIETS